MWQISLAESVHCKGSPLVIFKKTGFAMLHRRLTGRRWVVGGDCQDMRLLGKLGGRERVGSVAEDYLPSQFPPK